ncbi:DUF4397 domain-containing protein [Mucilaginibacter sp.]
MIGSKNNTLNGFLLLIITTVFLTPYLSSCGKSGNASSVGLNVQFEVLNLSPDIQPVDLYLGFIKQNTNSYFYPFSSGYFYLNSIDTPLQIRSSATTLASSNFFTIDKLNFQANHKYSLFITGLRDILDPSQATLTAILTTDDTASIPPIGFGKIRFVNCDAIQGTGLDVTANGTLAFSAVKFAQVSPYATLPVGNYIFQVTQTGIPGTILNTTLGSTTIQDGHLYTLYSYGIPLRTDSSAFNAAMITNR